MRRNTLLTLALIGALWSSAQAARPAHRHHTAVSHHHKASRGKKAKGHPLARLHAAPVYAGKHVVMTVYGSSWAEAHRRATAIQARVDENLKAGTPAGSIGLRKSGRVLAVAWGGHTLSTIDALQTRGNHMKPWALGSFWVGNLQDAARRQTFTVSEKSVLLGVGDTHTVRMTGLMAGPTRATADNLVSVQVDDRTHQVTLKAAHAGQGLVLLHRGRVEVPIKVKVEELAGTIPADLTCTVAGDPAPKAVENDALLYALKGNIHLASGATIYMKGEPPLPDTLTPGQSTSFAVPLAVEGTNLLPVHRTVHVTIVNKPVVAAEDALLMVSSRPQNLDGNGVVFTGTFGPGRPARLVYSHENRGSKARQICVTLTNRADKPAQVFLIGVPGTPAVNEGLASTSTASTFLQRYTQSAGVVLTIPPRTAWQVMQQSIPSQQRIVGMAHLECLSGEDLEVTVHARENGVPLTVAARTVLADPGSSDNHPKGTFASPNVSLKAAYQVGDPTVTIPLGRDNPRVDTASGESNVGNNGMLYRLSVKISNPASQPRRVTVSYGAGENPGRASFLVGEKLKETELVPAGTDVPLETVDLGPHDIRTVELTTVAAPGYNLPARIVVRTEADGSVGSSTPAGNQPVSENK